MKRIWQKSFGFLQNLSKALVIPVTFIPAAALMLALSFWFKSFPTFANTLNTAGTIILDLLPLLFVASISYGLSKEREAHLVIVAIISYLLVTSLSFELFKINIEGHLTAIILGIILVYLYQFLKGLKMPNYFIFFEGNRFAAIGTLILSLLLTAPIAFILNGSIEALNSFGAFLNSSNLISPFIFGTTSRLLIPSGLHHIWHNAFWFDTLGINAMPLYLQGLGSAKYFTGFYLIMIFALPGAALAIIHTAKNKNKKIIKTLMFTAIVSSVLLGITEPIEMSFIFVSPLLFIFHAVMSGIAMLLVNLLNISIGFSFSAGLLDFIIQLQNPINDMSKLILLLPLGIVFGVIYYFTFKFLILKFNLLTPGRSKQKFKKKLTSDKIADDILKGLGGRSNIVNLDHCATRLRLIVNNPKLVDDKYLKEKGALSVLKANKSVQVVIGPEVEGVANFMKNKTNDNKLVKFKMPIKGSYDDISKTPDEVFSQKLLGPGFVINPLEGLVTSPVKGTVSLVYPSKHAIAVTTDNGIDIMIHFGIDTVELNGMGFDVLVAVGDKVNIGDTLMNVDLNVLENHKKDLSTPVIFVQKEDIKIVKEKNNILTIEVI